jgi:hypothetical protein
LREDIAVECIHERVSVEFVDWGSRRQFLTLACSYFPTVYEPTVFENYVHGKQSILFCESHC